MLKRTTLAIAFLSACMTQATAFEVVTAQDFTREILGKPIVFIDKSSGVPVKGAMQYAANGKVIKKTILGKEAGVWQMDGDKVCTNFTVSGSKCFGIVRSG